MPESREVKFVADLLVPHAISVDAGELVIGVDASQTTLVSRSFTVMSGGPFSNGVATLLESELFGSLLEGEIRENIAALQDGFPSIDIGFLEPLLGPVLDEEQGGEEETEIIATSRSVDGALTIGLDVYRSGFGTAGNPAELLDVTRDLGLAVWANPDLWIPNTRDQLLEPTNWVSAWSFAPSRVKSSGSTSRMSKWTWIAPGP